MTDRTYILLIVFLIAMGFYGYQKALNDQGGVTVLEQFMQGKEPSTEEEASVDATLEHFEFEQKVSELYQKIDDIASQREALLEEDERTIASMLELNAAMEGRLYDLADSLPIYWEDIADAYQKSATIGQALKYLQDLSELNGIIENELHFFLMNAKGSDYELKESLGFLDEKVVELVNHIDDPDPKGLAGILKDFSSLEIDALKIRQNMQEHILYLVQRHKKIQQVCEQILGFLAELDGDFTKELSDSYAQTGRLLTEKLNRSAKSTLSVLQLFDEQMSLIYDIVELAASRKEIDLQAFKEELGLVPTTQISMGTPEAAGAPAGSTSGQIQLIQTGGVDVDALRSRQKKDEEMLNTMLKVYGPGPQESSP